MELNNLSLEFCSLHNHTDYSNLRLIDCIIPVNELIDEAYSKGYSGVAITDHEALSSHIKAIKHFKEMREKDKFNKNFKLILGNEIYLTSNRNMGQTYYHFLLLAKDEIGHEQLRKLSSIAWKNSYFDRRMERTPILYSEAEAIIGENKGHLIASTACLGSYLAQEITSYIASKDEQHRENINAFMLWCLSMFGEDFYVELQPGISDEQIEYNKLAVAIAKAYNVKFIVTTDTHYINKEDKLLHHSFLNSKDEERETGDFYASTYMHSINEMIECMDYLGDDVVLAIQNTMEIYNKCDLYDLKQDTIIPEPEVSDSIYKEIKHIFKDYYNEYEYINNFANSKSKQDLYFFSMIEKGFLNKSEEFNEENIGRINTELKELWLISEAMNQHISSYYSLTKEIIDLLWDDNEGDSLVMPARGSVTGFYTAYLVDIIQVNPLKHNLPHWRHLESSRPELPDIDIDSQASRRSAIINALRRKYGDDNVLNICTFKTEKTKSAILTSCRGLNINNDIAQYLSDLVPVERGEVWSITECLKGNEEKNRKPIQAFIDELNQHENLKETILKVNGLIVGRSIHASGVYIFKNGVIKQNAFMKAPNGQLITCWSMEDSDYVGGLKIDLLTVLAADKIRKTMNLLLEHDQIQWQGSLRDTYNKYLHPDVIEYENPDMWKLMQEKRVIDLFQYETLVGEQTIDIIQPCSLYEMAAGNSLMRLMSNDGVSPLEKYAKFKKNPELWFEEMNQNNLLQQEMEILNKHLAHSYGISGEQEDIMILSMDENIANFSVAEANKLRKAVAKKKNDLMAEIKKLFYEKGKESNTRQTLLDYVWKYCILPQAGYAFSRNHSVPYSIIGIIELNLNFSYNPIFWATACLTVNSGYMDDEHFIDDDFTENNNELDEDEESDENTPNTVQKKKKKATKYGKIAKAISDIQKRGISVFLPDINKADMEFKPDIENNGILFGLKAMVGASEELIEEIIKNRPYNSFEDFINKINITPLGLINIIKAGCFDSLYPDKSRIEIMEFGIYTKLKQTIEPKTKLTMTNFKAAFTYNIFPDELSLKVRFNRYKAHLKTFKDKDGFIYLADKEKEFFMEHFSKKIDHIESDNKIAIKFKALEKIIEKEIEEIRQWFSLESTIDKFNEAMINYELKTILNQRCSSSIAQWEMEAINFYYTEHELENIQNDLYMVSEFGRLPEEPEFYIQRSRYGKEYKIFNLTRIVGTVIDKIKSKHIVYLLTKDGVVNVKMYDKMFAQYNKQISVLDPKTGKKRVVEKSWFARGSKLLLTGYRSGDYFFPRKYKNSAFQYPVSKIEVDPQNPKCLLIQTERTEQ